MHVIKEPKNWSFDKAGHTGKILSTHDLINTASFTLIEVEKKLAVKIRERECDFTYYILSGHGAFIIDGKEEQCMTGDLVVVPHGKIFTFRGKMRMLLIVSPPFRPEQDEVIE